ncbi:MAG: ATP-binding protein [Hyalangium sp.]|uniref:ATP-binding protein n=1 Tax=Hyalangium sp. TaxID=2028555 RepID=UPI0038999663
MSVRAAVLEHPGIQAQQEPSPPSPWLGPWLLAWLDSLLSKQLPQNASAELARYRVLMGATLFLLLLSLLDLAYGRMMARPLLTDLMSLVMVGALLATLVLLRRASSSSLPAWLLCSVLTLELVISLFRNEPTRTPHAAIMLSPLLALYLLGPRRSLPFALFLSAVLGVAVPLLHPAATPEALPYPAAHYWMLNGFAALCVLGSWALGALYSTAHAESEAAHRQTLRSLSESEGKLLSLIESTDDLVCSLDLEGRLVTSNTAAKHAFFRLFGQEIAPGQSFFRSTTPERRKIWDERFASILAGGRLRFEEELRFSDKNATMETSFNPIRGADGRITGVTIFSRDITARKEAETRLAELHRTLVDISRQAGMAEVATGVLHNVGNTLNSVNVSAQLIADTLRKPRVARLVQTVELMEQQGPNLGAFLASDSKGCQLLAYLKVLSQQMGEEQQALLQEMQSLNKGIEHIKSIVNMQQEHARTVGTVERLPVPQLIDEALRLHSHSIEGAGIHIERDYAQALPILVDRHKLLQILVNLLSNARYALLEAGREDKRLSIRVRATPDSQRLIIEVADNGAGIAPEHLPRIFSQGFTTKKDGHGFGLHSSALAATELKGRLSCVSPGPGQGATFTLELPMKAGEQAAELTVARAR